MSLDIRRYLVILELLKNADGLLTSQQIAAGLKREGIIFKSSTFSRDYQFLVGLGFKIHNPKTKGYKIEIEDTEEFSFLTNLFKRIALSNLLNKSITLENETHKYLSLDDTSLVKNFQYFDLILEAIKNRKELSFEHSSFYHTGRKEPKTHTIKPQLLKEYQNRWYVVGETENGFRVFGLDRLSDLQVLDNKPFRNKTEEANEKLSHTVGLNFSDYEPRHIVLRFDVSQKPYLESLKLHRSQEELTNGSNGFYTVKLFVSYNFELKQQLLKYGSLVQVLEPDFVRADIKAELEKAFKAY
ncbi:WYL domain-containing protein [Subsaximicrobium wynnwilliamsii]|uniref:WYL domain-containing protein n=1 Tax=Subsaximicrobium wynnwilliamsii TaxID=291179 RepID=A0A5C6ZBY4_9FLAO|nr:WYL domain-containing protein [Subsaximicrobium wynnwilliamsii]TXD81870.1 WYL domain-containing protein [Subsaximicrobium wynnwilliamsii]TXD87539.1 WYL domain-containing protein [Subsaximicrobium wynnwilliamsii]TXE01222.1 WYL domain-containing protein [Subsaximicrobium wynnwilliamsii]